MNTDPIESLNIQLTQLKQENEILSKMIPNQSKAYSLMIKARDESALNSQYDINKLTNDVCALLETIQLKDQLQTLRGEK